LIVDDRSTGDLSTPLGTRWELLTDGVMGGVSQGRLAPDMADGRACLRLSGDVSLENNGGFVQMAVDLRPGGGPLDVRAFVGVALTVSGNGETYGLHLRTTDLSRPWQSYRQGFRAGPDWAILHLPFAGFAPHRTEAALNLAGLRRIGLVAIGRPFQADLALADLRFYA
jgi:hypothetical protein